jgi:hypothetical protein
MQIGKRIQRLERAQLAAERRRMTRRSESGMPDVNISEGMHMNLDARYEVSISRNNPVNIYNFVRAHHGDPAITVSLRTIGLRVLLSKVTGFHSEVKGQHTRSLT